MKKNFRQQKGFTLIEFLVLAAIIALIVMGALWLMNSARVKARDARRLTVVQHVQSALQMYFYDHNAYPEATNAIRLGSGTDCKGNSCISISSDAGIANAPSGILYMKSIPDDPSVINNRACGPNAKDTCGYTYRTVGEDNNQYEVWFYLESNTGGYAAGPVCATETRVTSGNCIH